jgi:hypothetical protein
LCVTCQITCHVTSVGALPPQTSQVLLAIPWVTVCLQWDHSPMRQCCRGDALQWLRFNRRRGVQNVECKLVWWGETAVSELRPWATYTIPGWYRCEPLNRRDRLGLTPNLTTTALWSSRRWAKEMRISSIHPCGTSKVILHAVKSYDMGPPTLLPIREEGVLRIFIVLKIPSPWPGSNPQTLGPVASTLTTRPPRRRVRKVCREPFRVEIWHAQQGGGIRSRAMWRIHGGVPSMREACYQCKTATVMETSERYATTHIGILNPWTWQLVEQTRII